MLVCLNGQFIPREEASVAINDGGFLFGDTLFETLKASGKKILLVPEHLNRLEISAELLDFPFDRKKAEASLKQLSQALTSPVSRIRLTLSRGRLKGLSFPTQSEGYFLLTAVPAEAPSEQEREAGASCVTTPNQRVNPLSHLPQMKRGNYADCLYATNYANRKGAREALFVDNAGHVLEGSTSNLFIISNDALITPPIGNMILAGIMRREVIDAATELGYRVEERSISVADLQNSQEAFLTNSLIELLPIASHDGHSLNRGESWKTILKTLRMRIET